MEFEFKQTQFDPDSLKLYSKLLSEVFPSTKKYTPEFLNWQYNLNPNGPVIGFDAFLNGELAAHYVTIPVEYIKDNKNYKGLLSLNTATNSKFQGKGLFTKLADKTYDFAKNNGYQFVIGVANQNSTHGFIKKLGFHLIAPLDAYIYLGDNEKNIVADVLFQSQMNEAAMTWRINNPSNPYFFSNGFIYSSTDKRSIKACLSKAKTTQQKNNASLLLKMAIGINNKPNTLFKIKIPNKLKPSPLNLIFKKIDPEFNLQINASNTFFELIDFDAY